MSAIIILTGAPGTGKTTLAAHLAKSDARGLHMPADVFFTFPARPIPPHTPAAHGQNTDIMIALARSAEAFARRGYQVFLDGIFGPWFLPVIASELRPAAIPVRYVVLRAPLETCLSRVRQRCGSEKDEIVRHMHAQFANLGAYAKHAIEVGGRSVDEAAEEFQRREAAGDFTLDLESVAKSGVNQ